MLYIDGEWCHALSGEMYPVYNPATSELVDTVARGGEDDTKSAIMAAKSAFSSWSKLPAKERSYFLKKVADILRGKVNDLAKLITTEMGKPTADAKAEINLAIDYLDWYAEEAKRIYGDTIPASSEKKRLLVLRQPVGVVAAITPWNFPMAMITRKLAPALAAGCTVIVKPAESTPLTAIEVIKAFDQAKFPKGVVNLVHGKAPEIGEAFMKSSVVRKVTFTGSTKVGKELARQSADTMKKISMELGGHAPFIIFEDADLEKAVDGVITSKFRNSGQTCVCTNRVYVQKSVYSDFNQLFIQKVKELVVGNGLDAHVHMGPLISEQAIAKVEEQVQDAISKGAELLCGGKRPDGSIYEKGHFYEPTILLHATNEMKIAFEETFGPVAPVFEFTSEEEVIKLANETQYGLASYLYTKDVSRIFRVSEALEYGIVGINDPLPAATQAPFGGIKESGIGREGGKYGIEDYLDYKYLSLELEM